MSKHAAKSRSGAWARYSQQRPVVLAAVLLVAATACTTVLLLTAASAKQLGLAGHRQAQPFNDQVAVIVELQQNPHLLTVLANFAENLQPEAAWPIQVFYGDLNRDFLLESEVVQALLASQRTVYLDPLGVDELSYKQYNHLCKQASFWRRVRGERILMFQSDCVLCGPTDLSQFAEWDWIGTAWAGYWDCNDGVHDQLVVGNGGLSLRRRSALLEVLQSYPQLEGTTTDWTRANEDFYFACALSVAGHKLAPVEAAREFGGQEGHYHEGSVGVHGPHKYGKPEWRGDYGSWCPAADWLFDLDVNTPMGMERHADS